MREYRKWGAIGLVWAVLAGPTVGGEPDAVARAGLAYCRSIGEILRVAADARDAGVAEADQQAQAARHATGTSVDDVTALAIARVYRDRRAGAVLAEAFVRDCAAALPPAR